MELAQGEPPYYDTQPMKVMLLIANNRPPTLKQAEKFSPELNDFIASCLVKDPEGRPSAALLLKVNYLHLPKLRLFIS